MVQRKMDGSAENGRNFDEKWTINQKVAGVELESLSQDIIVFAKMAISYGLLRLHTSSHGIFRVRLENMNAEIMYVYDLSGAITFKF